MLTMRPTELLLMLGHDPAQVQWDLVPTGPAEPDLFLVFKRLGYRDFFCLAYEILVAGVTVTLKLKSVSRYDPFVLH